MVSRRASRRVVGMSVSLALLATVVAQGCSQASRLRARCLAGDNVVCAQLGEMYVAGRGVPRDLGRAAEMYERACDGGMPDVCNTLGEIHERSGDLEGGMARATELYQKACDGGSSAGCLNLGLVFAAREEKAKAVALYERSCAGGWAAGCHQLAVCYEQADGVARDIQRAIALYSQACDGEHGDSCVAAGNLFAAGEQVARDVVVAMQFYGKGLKLFNEACEGGSQGGCTERDRLRSRMAILSAGQPVTTGAPPVRR